MLQPSFLRPLAPPCFRAHLATPSNPICSSAILPSMPSRLESVSMISKWLNPRPSTSRTQTDRAEIAALKRNVAELREDLDRLREVVARIRSELGSG